MVVVDDDFLSEVIRYCYIINDQKLADTSGKLFLLKNF